MVEIADQSLPFRVDDPVKHLELDLADQDGFYQDLRASAKTACSG
jgi:hypothetical protein